MNIVYMLMAACAGSFIALQATANASLRHRLNDPWYAAFFSICGTITTAVILMLIFRPSPRKAQLGFPAFRARRR